MKAQKITVQESNADTTLAKGLIGVNPNKPEYGSIQLKTQSFSFGGFAAPSKIVHFLAGTVEDLKSIITEYNLKAGDDFSMKVQPSRLIVKESTTPFYEGQKCKINPTTGEEVTSNGNPVYRETRLVEAGSSEYDEKVASTKTSVASTSDAAEAEYSDDLSA